MPFAYLVDKSNEALAHGATRLELADSYSSLSPEGMKTVVRRLRSQLTRPVPLTVHIHNDFGLATAGAIAAVTAGAHPDVSVNGVSYRSGFAALEEVVVSLELLYDLRAGIDMASLQTLSQVVEEQTGWALTS